MKVGLIAPVFERATEPALAVAQQADADGLDGVFSYDHLFPMKAPQRPSLSAIPMLAAMAMRTERVTLGTLVSRVTLLPLPVLVESLATLDELSGGRVIVGIGTGDSLTAPENEAYGLTFPPLSERLRLLGEAARALRAKHVTTWIGGRSQAVRAVAAADADAWNCWDCSLDDLAAAAQPVTWAGPPPADGAFEEHLAGLAQAGVTWAVYGPPPSIDWPAFVAKLAGAAKTVR